ncbi:MAG: 6-bladed beta-propeller [Vicinamibacterales bacterium]
MTIRLMLSTTLAFSLAACSTPPGSPAAGTSPGAQPGAPAGAPAAAPAGGGLAGTAEQRARQEELEKATPQLKVTEQVLNLSVPGQTIGETVGVAKNAAGSLFVFSRTGKTAQVKGSAASMLFEFDPSLRYVKEWGPNSYGAGFAHTVRVDKDQNVWVVDEGSNMVIKYRPDASVAMVLGRKEEPLDWLERFTEEGDHLEGTPNPRPGVFNRPTDVTWDNDGNIFVSDGYNNSRVAKFTKDGTWVKAIGERGAAPNQFNTPHGITSDATGNIYVADRGNRRVQVFNPDLEPVRIIEGMGAPWSVCVSPGATQYLFSGDGNGKIYKFSLDGTLVGWAQTSLGHGQSGCLVHELHCESDTVLYKGDCSTWTVEKITIAP